MFVVFLFDSVSVLLHLSILCLCDCGCMFVCFFFGLKWLCVFVCAIVFEYRCVLVCV